MLHASETWLLTKPSLQRLQPNDRAMIRQICNVKPQNTANIRSTELLARLSIEDLDLILKERRLRWYGLMEPSTVQSRLPLHTDCWKVWAMEAQYDLEAADRRDCRESKLSAIDPHDRDTWRSGVRSAMRAVSQYLEG